MPSHLQIFLVDRGLTYVFGSQHDNFRANVRLDFRANFVLGIFELLCPRKFSSHGRPLRSAKPRTRSRLRLTSMDGYWCNKYGGTTVRGITQGKVRYALRSFKGQLRRPFRFRVQKRNCANAPAGMEPRFKRCPKLPSRSSRNCLLCLRCSSPLCDPSLNFGLEILSAVTSCIHALVRTWIYADRILSNETDSTIYSREFHGAELGRSLSHNRGDSLHVTHLEKWPNQGDVANGSVVHAMDVYEVRSRTDKRGVHLVSDALPFGRLWYAESNAMSNAIRFEKFSRACPEETMQQTARGQDYAGTTLARCT